MSEEKKASCSVQVTRKANLGDFENVEVSVHMTSGTVQEEALKQKAEELSELATERMMKTLAENVEQKIHSKGKRVDSEMIEEALDDLRRNRTVSAEEKIEEALEE